MADVQCRCDRGCKCGPDVPKVEQCKCGPACMCGDDCLGGKHHKACSNGCGNCKCGDECECKPGKCGGCCKKNGCCQ